MSRCEFCGESLCGGTCAEAKAHETDRHAAIKRILWVLRDPIALLSPERQDALDLAKRYQVTAEELLEAAARRARKV